MVRFDNTLFVLGFGTGWEMGYKGLVINKLQEFGCLHDSLVDINAAASPRIRGVDQRPGYCHVDSLAPWYRLSEIYRTDF